MKETRMRVPDNVSRVVNTVTGETKTIRRGMNYKKVIEDFNSCKIDRSEWCLTVDNDDGFWSYIGEGSDDDMLCEEKSAKMKSLYGEPSGYGDIVDILIAAGVNAEWC